MDPQPPDLLVREQTDLQILEAPGGDGVFNPDGTVNMALIRPCNGRGPYSNIYEAEVLARDAGVFKGFPMFDNHDSPVARKARQGLPRAPSELAGVVRESWWDPDFSTPEDAKMGFGRGAVIGRCALTDPMEALVRKVPEAVKGSLNCRATNKRLGERNGAKGWIVEGFVGDTENSSFDLVTKAGAGGRVASCLEALYDDGNATDGPDEHDDPPGGVDPMNLQEALQSDEVKGYIQSMIDAGVQEAVQPAVAEAVQEAAVDTDAIREAVREEMASENRHRSLAIEARGIIEASKLPKTAQEKLLADYGIEEAGDESVTPGRGLAVIEAEVDDSGTVTKPAKVVLREALEEEIKGYRAMISEFAPTVPRAPVTAGAGVESTNDVQESAWEQQLRRRGVDLTPFGVPARTPANNA